MAKLFVVDKFPAEYASGIYTNDRVWAQFSVPISSGTATYYNFTVNERDTYEPVDGRVSVEGISGGLNETIVIFTPENGFKRNTSYSVLVSTGIKAKTSDDYLKDDYVWFFTTGNSATSGVLGGGGTGVVPSGVSTSGDIVSDTGLIETAEPLLVVETAPVEYSFNVARNIPFIGIRFNGVIPSGINLYDHISLTARRVLG